MNFFTDEISEFPVVSSTACAESKRLVFFCVVVLPLNSGDWMPAGGNEISMLYAPELQL